MTVSEPILAGGDTQERPPRRSREVELRGSRAMVGAYAVIWLACLSFGAATARGFYGDGALFVFSNLREPGRFFDYDTQRSFASYITQAPLLLGQRLGMDAVAVYGALFHLGTFVLPATAFVLALYLSRAQPLLFALNASAVAVYGFGINLINSEANLFFAFVVLSATILSLRGTQVLFRAIVLPMLAFALLRIYEGMVLVGPVLFIWCALLYQQTSEERERPGLLIAAFLFALASVIGAGGFLSPRDPGNARAFVSNLSAYLVNPQVFILLSSASFVAVAILSSSKLRTVLALLGTGLAMAFVYRLHSIEGYYSHRLYHENRAFLVLSMPIFVGALLVLSRRGECLASTGARWSAYLMVPFLAAAAGDAIVTYRWQAYTKGFCEVLAKQSVRGEGVAELKQRGYVTGWTWTHPTLSWLLRARGSEAMVNNESFQTWQPFDPASVKPSSYRGLCEGFASRHTAGSN